jgi:hypothetical protein
VPRSGAGAGGGTAALGAGTAWFRAQAERVLGMDFARAPWGVPGEHGANGMTRVWRCASAEGCVGPGGLPPLPPPPPPLLY